MLDKNAYRGVTLAALPIRDLAENDLVEGDFRLTVVPSRCMQERVVEHRRFGPRGEVRVNLDRRPELADGPGHDSQDQARQEET